MHNNEHKWLQRVVCLFLTVIILLFLIITLRTAVNLILVEKMQIRSPWIKMLFYDNPRFAVASQKVQPIQKKESGTAETADIYIDWAAEYPFEENEMIAQRNAAAPSRLDAFTENVKAFENKVSSAFRKMIPEYDSVIMASAKLEEWIGWDIPQYMEYNATMELYDDYFITVTPINTRDLAIRAYDDLNQFCQQQGTRLICVIPPSKVDPVKDTQISGHVDFSNRNKDLLVQQLTEKNIAYIDLRRNVREDGLDTHGLFFGTDHHWKPETGLWASAQIADYLNQSAQADLDISLFAADRYEHMVLKDWFLGSNGKKVTLARTAPDDFTVLYPRYDTEMNLKIPSRGIDQSGDFTITYDARQVETKDLMNLDPYAAYGYGNNPLAQYRNLKDSSDLKILMLKDSYGNVVAPFLAQAVSQLDALDLRLFTGSVQSYIRETEPDVVIVLYNLIIPIEVDWESHRDVFDFR